MYDATPSQVTDRPHADHRRRTPRLTAVALCVVALALLAGCGRDGDSTTAPAEAESTSTTAPEVVVPRSGIVDRRVAVSGGARLHVHCEGTGTTTVVLVSGFAEVGDSWTSVRPAIARRTRVCSYDRFGIGASDRPPTTQTFSTQAEDLHTLLREVGEPGPYVVVGHSFGGAEAVSFTSQFPEEVSGLLLLDATPASWPEAVCAVEDDGSAAADEFRGACAQQEDPTANPEHLDVPTAFAEVGEIGSLGSVPMVVTAPAERLYEGLEARQADHLTELWNEGQEHWAALSPSARLVSVEDTGHYIQLDRPAVVIDEVRRLLA